MATPMRYSVNPGRLLALLLSALAASTAIAADAPADTGLAGRVGETLSRGVAAINPFTATETGEVQVADAYLELHTGPGRGYPVFYVAAQGEWIEVLKRRTDWFKVRVFHGHEGANKTRWAKEGWVRREALATTLTAAGKPLDIHEPAIGDFSSRRWEMGVLGGGFSGADVISVYGGYAFNGVLSAELTLSQVLGEYSDSQLADVSLLASPFPRWRISPFFSLGSGMIRTNPQVTLVQAEDRIDPAGHAGIGVRAYLTRRFLLRAEYRHHTLFTTRDSNQEIDEWKAGIAFFF